MQFPDFLEPYRTSGYKIVQQGGVKGFQFSGPTYQFEIEDPKLAAPLWVFLQFDDRLEIKDLFCSCEESTEKGACAHMAAACLYVLSKKNSPPHIRFEESLWHKLLYSMFEAHGARALKVVHKDTLLEVYSEKELLFSAKCSPKCKGNNFSALLAFLQTKVEQTEETSIKFSNLTEEELDHWRRGRPSFRLRYELSPFADIAKWLFLKQETNEQLQVRFYPTKEIPTALTAVLQDLEIDMPIDMFDFVGAINTVPGNLQLLDKRQVHTKSIVFDPKTNSFTFHFSPMPKSNRTGAIPFGPWQFLPDVGFVSFGNKPKERERLADPKEIEELFTKALSTLKEHLLIPIVETPPELKYEVFWKELALHIRTYLHKKGDLDNAPMWGQWSYCGNAFMKIGPLKFETAHRVVERGEIGSFLLQNRTWLSQYHGFQVHVAKLEEQILYSVDEYGNLTFRSVLQKLPSIVKCVELGDWLYAEGDGFYVKNFTEDNPPLPLGKLISKHAVADFIRHHIDLLETVPDFFAKTSPIRSIGLSVKLKRKGTIEILPEYEWHDPQHSQRSFFYDEFLFVQGVGFFRLPPSFRPLHFIREISSEDKSAWTSFFEELLPRLKEEYPCKIDPRLERAQSLALTVQPQDGAGSRLQDWDVQIYWKGRDAKVQVQDLVSAKKRQERFVPTDAGMVDLEEDRFHWLDSLRERKKGPLSLSSSDVLRLSAYDEIHVETQGVRSREAFKNILERLLSQKPLQEPDFTALIAELRPYQKHGVDWLWFLYQNGLSGLLCDDMGVGKTHQAMGLMASVRKTKRAENQQSRFLVICPTSLIFHWQDKLARYLPDFKVKVYVGFTRTLDDFPGDYDILLTSYGIWRNESQKFKKIFFDSAFFDELQIAKNHVSQIHAALLQVHAGMFVGLTGTPIENQLRELKALFDIILPGYMPIDSDFREFFVRPIEKGENVKRRELLARFVKPFVLRRRKRDVLPDLPEKTEELCVAELADEQKRLYSQVSSHQVLPLIQQLRDESMPIPYMHIFAVLSSLKQICNHPATYLKDVANYERYESGKWEFFVELIEEAIESEQKVVVFSQFLAMLDIIEQFLKKNKIRYAQIRGQTKNRGDEVMRFHNDPNCKIFLGSLQAAGLGIDLTPASVVIHYDRWWNAARENQATDRVHRFGQVRGVQVYKLLTKSTIEERIDQMIAKKADLLEEVVSFDDHQIVKKLSRQEIISLLQGSP